MNRAQRLGYLGNACGAHVSLFLRTGTMRVNEIDQFRQAFFDNIIDAEKKKEQAEKILQQNCFHLYNIIGETYDTRNIGYQHRTCSKCGHSAIKRRTVWEGTKGCALQ